MDEAIRKEVDALLSVSKEWLCPIAASGEAAACACPGECVLRAIKIVERLHASGLKITETDSNQEQP